MPSSSTSAAPPPSPATASASPALSTPPLSPSVSPTTTASSTPSPWEHIVTQPQPQSFSWRPVPDEKRGFTLCIRKKDKPIILHSYLDHIMDKANDIRRKNQDRLLYTNSHGGALDSHGHPWESVPFKHPSTFETLAMDPTRKEEIMVDLRDFVDGKTLYQKTGQALRSTGELTRKALDRQR